jgi:hypothetical protein
VSKANAELAVLVAAKGALEGRCAGLEAAVVDAAARATDAATAAERLQVRIARRPYPPSAPRPLASGGVERSEPGEAAC